MYLSNRFAGSKFTKFINITSNTNNFNLRERLKQEGWGEAKRSRVFLNIAAGVTIGSTSVSQPALLVNLRDVDFVQITNNGNIFGAGGAGGGSFANSNGGAGGAGGTALRALSNMNIINNGVVGGGAGGNGGEGAYRRFLRWVTAANPCPIGGGYQNSNFLGNPPSFWGVGTCGRCELNRDGIGWYAAACTAVYDYPASSAGTAGAAGAGTAGTTGGSPWYAGGSGGAAGAYYQGSNKINILNAGTIRGNIINE